jgi:nitrite reductase/ring-hydroxylating ferredoxin subunit
MGRPITELSSISIDRLGEVQELAARTLDGEVFVIRHGLQQLGLLEPLVKATLEGIRQAEGPDVAAQVEAAGFDRIHEFIKPAEIVAVTDAVYKIMAQSANDVLVKLVKGIFGGAGNYYFEKSPNVRFHIPFDVAASSKKEFDKFAEKRGQGKVAAHGPHRDPWVDCPENVINVWIAVGPVQKGNGLTVFLEDYKTDFPFKDGYIDERSKLHKPDSYDLEPGDIVLFHSNHLHGSELNRTNRTRYAISYRVAFGTPYYPHGHYHHYQHVGLASGPLRWLAGVPQNLQWSFVRYQLRRLRYKLSGGSKMTGRDKGATDADIAPEMLPPADGGIALAQFPVGTVRAASETAVVARLGEREFCAVSRYCRHMGGDLAGGWIEDGQLVCPMHSLPYDPCTGISPLKSLPPLDTFQTEERDGKLYVREEEATVESAAARTTSQSQLS